MEGISRESLDELAAQSQHRAAQAIAEGRFDRSLIPVLNLDGTVALDHEEFPRPGTTASPSPRWPRASRPSPTTAHEDGPTFRELINQKYPDLDIEHVHHAGNSSGVVDGAAAVLMASEDYAKAHGLTPRARIVATANMGDDPTLMLNAPVPAARKVLDRAGLTLDDIDLFEINEAFAVVVREVHPRPRPRPRQGQRQRRGDGPRPPDRRHRRHPDRHRARRARAHATASSASSPCAPPAAWPRPSSSNASDPKRPKRPKGVPPAAPPAPLRGQVRRLAVTVDQRSWARSR